MTTTLIALCGPAGSGKSTVATYLVERYGAKRYSFAMPLKEMVKKALDFTDEQVYGTQEQKEAVDPRYGHSPRWFLQRIGTEGCRNTFGENFWTDMLCAEGGLIWREAPKLAVIEDCRFLNEAQAVHRWDAGLVIRLWPVDDEVSVAHAAAAGAHASEEQWRRMEANLELKPRSRGVEQLYALVDAMMESITGVHSGGVRW